MSIAAKPILASALLMGVTVVWVPRITGYDPFGWLSEEIPTPSSTSFPDEDPFPMEEDDLDFDTPAPVTANESISLGSLRDVVGFLERRSETGGQVQVSGGADGGSVNPAPAPREMAEYVSQIETLLAPTPATLLLESRTVRQQLEEFLVTNPLHAIIEGKGLRTATFGHHRVQIGDELLDGALEVLQIDQRGVSLRTPDGPLTVRLPPHGAIGSYKRPVTSSPVADTDDVGDTSDNETED